ncbi:MULTISPECIES: hypothetical protein [Nocardia]|uniref:hypothetical protein n=1 Tax=Nocardia TaxID=1817 RepID=UPI0006FE2CF6|nr:MULTISPECIES: hypothetical protein [Nocardia]KQY29048.1 hypothetical protein ASD42_26500 [Nocardia sp. Root136]
MDLQISDSAGAQWFTRAAACAGFARRPRHAAASTAIGYVRTDLPGPGQSQYESLIRAAATDLGYDLLGTLVLTATPLNRLQVMVTEFAVDAVLCPSFAHLDGQVPTELLTVTDVIVVDPPITYCRWDPQFLD